MLRMSIFLKLTPWISSQFHHDPIPPLPLELAIFSAPRKPRFFLRFLHTFSGIPTTFTLPLGIVIYSSKSPISMIIMLNIWH